MGQEGMADQLLGGRYHLLHRLGEGGMAVVYKAQDTILGRAVAIKLLREAYAADASVVTRFRREAQAAAALSHPNIVAIYDVGQDGDQHYIVMEYVSGADLHALITRRGALPLSLALDIAEQACAALDYAHGQGIVHRDIKPHNILIASTDSLVMRGWSRAAYSVDEEPPVLIKVADFGLARSMTAPAISEAGIVWGTIHYLSPEQARGEPATPQSDIYALGVVLYQMVTGQLPFVAETPVALALKHINEAPPLPRRVTPTIPPAVEAIILKALAKDPKQRFASAGEMGHAIASYRLVTSQATRPWIAPIGGDVSEHIPVQEVGKVLQEPQARLAQPVTLAPVKERPIQGQQRGIDCLFVTLAIVTFLAIAGLVPMALAVRDVAFPPTPTAAPAVSVPSIVGLPRGEAEMRLGQAGLQLQVQDERFDTHVPEGNILAQLIAPGTPVQRGTIIPVIVSRGVEQVRVPQLVGLPIQAAVDQLGSFGLAAERLDAPSGTAISGTVIAQDPKAGVPVPRGSTIRLTVSIGDKVVVPNLFGLPEAQAQSAIRTAGLATTFVNYQGPEDVPPESRWVFGVVPVGSVISQDPPAGRLVDRGTVVRIAVRKR